MVEDRRADSLVGIQVALTLWEQTVIPSLLYGSEVWGVVPKKTMDQLVKINDQFLKSILGIGKFGCPLVALYLETGTPTMNNRVLHSQLLFYHHVATLSDDSLAKMFLKAQHQNKNLPSIFRQCEKFLEEWGIDNVHEYSKPQWSRFMKSKMMGKNLMI